MQLIYRGQTIEYTAHSALPLHHPRAVNWRYQVFGKTVNQAVEPVRVSRTPQAINWRWQLAVST